MNKSPLAALNRLLPAVVLVALLQAATPGRANAPPGTLVKPAAGQLEPLKQLCLREATRDGHMGHNSFPDEVYFRKGYTLQALDELRQVNGPGEPYYIVPLLVSGVLSRTAQQVEVRRECQIRRAGQRDAYVILANRQSEILSGVGATRGPEALKPLSQMSEAERSALKPSQIAARSVDMREPRNQAIAAEMDRLEARYLDQVKNLCKARADADHGARPAWRVTRLLGRKDWKHSHNFFVVVRAVDASGNYAFVCEVWAEMPPDQKHWVEGRFTVGRFYKNNEAVIVEGMK